MYNFTVGPVASFDEELQVISQQCPYFRNEEFSNQTKRLGDNLLMLSNASANHKILFFAGSGTFAMQTSITNLLNRNDKCIVINGGTFGQRFEDMLNRQNIPNTVIYLDFGEDLDIHALSSYDNQGYTALLVNMCETSSGVLYNIKEIADFCKRNNLLFIVDGISAFLADYIDISKYEIDAFIISSQKALACQPGVSSVILSEKAIGKIYSQTNHMNMYDDLRLYIDNSKRFQNPFTPPVGIMLQMLSRTNTLIECGGQEIENNRIHELANYFRSRIIQNDLPISFIDGKKSNCVTSLLIKDININAKDICNRLKEDFNIWVCPNSEPHSKDCFRVGHLGNISQQSIDYLVKSLKRVL